MKNLLRTTMGLSLCILAYGQNGENINTAYPVPLFSTAPDTAGNLYVWQWHTYDSTRQRINDHNLSTGPDVVWRLILPECLDSMEVHFCPSDYGGIPMGNKLFVINATSDDTLELLQDSYDDYMLMWTIFRPANWMWPGSAYITGGAQSLLRRAGTGNGYGYPLYDTLRLTAGDTLYFIYTHQNTGGMTVDSVYLEIKAIQKIRPTPPPIAVSAQVSLPQACMGSLIDYLVALRDTANDGRTPRAYWTIDTVFIDGVYSGRGTGMTTEDTIRGSFSLSTSAFNPNRGYIDYTVRLIGGGIYANSVYPTISACDDTSAPSAVVTYNVRLTAYPDPRVRYSGTDYGRGDTIRIPEGTRTFSARDGGSLADSLLRYEWRINGNVVGNAASLTRTLTPGTYTLSLKLTNAPSGASACDSAISVVLDVSRPTSLSGTLGGGFSAYVSESGNLLTVYVEKSGSLTLRICDLVGRVIRSYSVEGGREFSLPLDVSAGTYILQAQGEDFMHNQRIVIR
ncbi:MAG: T9SS type A sorting domain-containing protein [Bacteroidia bacterium]|nr:T9SS type A sorting domain-containing protein [Bacteroidia bacterium]